MSIMDATFRARTAGQNCNLGSQDRYLSKMPPKSKNSKMKAETTMEATHTRTVRKICFLLDIINNVLKFRTGETEIREMCFAKADSMPLLCANIGKTPDPGKRIGGHQYKTHLGHYSTIGVSLSP